MRCSKVLRAWRNNTRTLEKANTTRLEISSDCCITVGKCGATIFVSIIEGVSGWAPPFLCFKRTFALKGLILATVLALRKLVSGLSMRGKAMGLQHIVNIFDTHNRDLILGSPNSVRIFCCQVANSLHRTYNFVGKA